MRKEPSPIFLMVSILYLFFNSFLLPDGLLFTTLLTPFFFMHLLKDKGIQVYFVFLLLSGIMAAVQLPSVEYLREYIKSFVLMQTVAVFAIHTFYVIRKEAYLEHTFKVLSTVNMVLLGVSILCLFIPVCRSWMWYEISMSEGLPIIPRLKMFTYEASYYSFIIVPLFVYYFLRSMLLQQKTGILFISLIISLALSFSFGVIAALIMSVLITYFLNINELIRKTNLNYIAGAFVLLIIGVAAVYWFYPHNIVFDRLANIVNGKDSSARGRTSESFTLAWNIAKMKSSYFGIGLGQLKLIGRDYIIQYYVYDDIPAVTRIPNAVAETLNIFGLVGVIARFGLIMFLFFKTKVWNNYYRLILFIFIFIYQFTGSFLFNIAEYVIWVLAFSASLFPQFNRNHFKVVR